MEFVLEVTAGIALSLAFLAIAFAFGIIIMAIMADYRVLRVLVGKLNEDLRLAISFGVTVGFYLGCFRVPFYPWYFLSSLRRLDFVRNPYRCDAVIRLPLWGVPGRLATLAQQQPEAAREFVEFLLARRPLQRGLAMHLAHAVTAETWWQQPLQADVLIPPLIVAEEPRFAPSDEWQHQLATLQSELKSSQSQSQISLKQVAFACFQTALEEFRQQTLREPPRWSQYYLDALATWQDEARRERVQLDLDAERLEPITRNVYRSGEALRPETDQALFLGRDDLRDRLAREILTAPNLPLLLIQGQRRVGKTSLLNFLPLLLGTHFKVVYQDLQDARVASVPVWLEDLRRRVASVLGWPEATEPAPADWVGAWRWFENAFTEVLRQRDFKLILALDEYEVLHGYLRRDPDAGARLLAAIRSFSQRQNQVVLLFVGAALLSELDDPDWSRYFVQTQRFQVDYLDQKAAERLITEPVKLHYPPAVRERLFDLTQGHPALLQLLCKTLVDIANRNQKADMSMADLDLALQEAIGRETYPMLVFWKQFCATPALRESVEHILHGEPPADAASRMRLEEHGFIVQRDGVWRLRVPLFEDWLRRYKDAYPLSVSSG